MGHRAEKKSADDQSRIFLNLTGVTCGPFANETGIKYLEIGPEITTIDSDLILGEHDRDWNAKANELIAAQLLRQLK